MTNTALEASALSSGKNEQRAQLATQFELSYDYEPSWVNQNNLARKHRVIHSEAFAYTLKDCGCLYYNIQMGNMHKILLYSELSQ